MDLGWLGGLLGSILNRLNPLKNIAHWRIWAEMAKWYERFRKWRDWYRDHVITPMKQEQAVQRQLFDTYLKPVLDLIDKIRRISSIVGIFDKRLADRLNFYFLRIEGYLLDPFNKLTQRQNQIARIFGGFLTPGGLFDRDGVLNTIWRDASLVKSVLHNPWGVHPAAVAAPSPTDIRTPTAEASVYLRTGGGPMAGDINTIIQTGHDTIQELQGVTNG